MAMSETTTLRNRLKHQGPGGADDRASTEELLIEKLDLFLSSIESRLDQFERYFKFNNLQELEDAVDEKETSDDSLDVEVSSGRSRRRSSTTSLSSFRNFAHLESIHSRLKLIKQSVLKSSTSNLEFLYQTLDDQYQYLFSSEGDNNESSFDVSKEALSRKIITTIQYFDEKLLHIDDMIKRKISRPVENDEFVTNIFKFYNFNKALKLAEEDNLHYYQLPLGWRENRYIINGYRFSLHHSTMLKSIFKFHNESMNIWSHLVGLAILVYIGAVHFPSTAVYHKNTAMDNLAVYFFLACAISCLTSSSLWHTYSCLAELKQRYTFACIDYTGITVLITASVIAVEYATLYNYPKLFRFFISFSALCGLGGLAFNWSPYFDRPECRGIRIGYFISLAGLGASTMLSVCLYQGFVASFKLYIPLFYKSFVFYWIGVIFYGGLIPEKWRYDVIIEEGQTCEHEHNSNDVLSGNIDNSGVEEIEEIETDMNAEILNVPLSEPEIQDEQEKFNEIINKHFPEHPVHSKYKNDFFSLWWVDYVLSSHNIWHVFVVLGILGHYSCLLEMFDAVTH